jgi:hypothetical protein
MFYLMQDVVSPTLDRQKKISQGIQTILEKTFSTCGKRVFTHSRSNGVMCRNCNARLYIRPIQLYILSFWKPSSIDLELISLTKHPQNHLTWWLQPVNVLQDKSFLPWSANVKPQNDASMSRWERVLVFK